MPTPLERAAPQVARQPGTTRYMVMLQSDRQSESGALPSPETLAAMGALMDELAQSGALLGGEGLKPSKTGARVKLAGDKRTVIDGPFTETKELIAGYLLIQTKALAEAVAFARRWLEIHCEAPGGGDGEIHIRPLFELEDVPTRR